LLLVCLNVNSKRDLNIFWHLLPKFLYPPQLQFPLQKSPCYQLSAYSQTQALTIACASFIFPRDSKDNLFQYKVGSPPPSHKPRQVSSFISEARLSKSQSSSKSYNTPQERDEDALSSGEASDKALVVLAPTQAFRVKRVKKLLATRKILHATTSDYYQTLATITSSPFNYYIIHQPTAQPLNNYINTTLTGGGTVIEIVGINNHSQRKSWYPQRTFPVVRSSHPLDVACGVDLLQQIQQACRKDFTEIVARHPTHPPLVVSVKDMRRLISYSSPISDSIMSLYLEKLTLTYGISYLATSFLHTLRSQGWTRLLSYFALYRNRPRSNSRPLVQGESAIILPCFVDGCHWVIVVRREIEGHVKFYYADDLNNGNTETDIKNLLSNNTSQEFYPPSASWTRCLNYTYRPHSNECGPRSLLAATILALHPDPSSNVLLPIMHKNLAQITRTWIAGQLIQENIDIEAIKNCIRATPTLMPLSTSSPSSPADLIQWKPGTEQNALSPNTSMKKKIQSLFPPLEHTIQKNPLRPLNPLAPIFIPSQTKDKEENKKHEAMSTLPRYRTNNQLLLTTTETTTSTASKKKKYVAPARRMETLLPGQTTLTRFFQCSKTSKAPIVPPLLSLPETNKTYSQDTVQSVSQTPPPIPQSTKSVQSPMQRTLFDFQFFKPYATISESDPNTWGHTPESIDTSTTFRLLFQNPNGIKPTVTEPDFLFSLHLCQEIGVAAICLAETNLNWNHSQHHVSLRRCLFRNWKSAKFQTSVPEEKFLGNYQPGGTATIVTDRWTSRVIKSGSDPLGLGRWSFIILRGKQDTSICVITAYRVCKDKTTGPKTAYQQQKRHLSSLLRTQGKVSTVDPHRQFILDLQAWITSKQAEGMQIILSLDNNEELMQNKGQLSPSPSDLTLPIVSASHDGTLETLVRSTGLVDVLRHKHPSDSYPPTYNRGKKRIDYILVSASLLSTVTRSGILPYNAVFQGDHRPCFIDIDVSLAFDGKIAEISPPCQRHLQLHDPRLVTKYLEVLSKQFQLHSIPEKVAALKQQSKTEWSEEKLLTYERLDASITQSMLYAERQTSKRYTKRYEWSPTLIKAVYAERYWRLMLRRSQGRQVSNELLQRTRLRADIPPTQHLYTLPEIISCLAAARQSRKSLQNDHHTLRQNYLEKLAAALVIKRAPYLEENPQYNDRLTKRTAKEVKRLIRLERKRYLYRIIGFTLNATTVNSTGLTHIDVPAASDSSLTIDPKTWKGPWRSVTDPEEIVHYICRMNTAQYHQAVTTPFGSGYLADTIGFNIDKPGAADILNGTFEISPSANLLPETKRILKFLQEPCHSTPDLPSEITPEEFKSTYKIVKERTSSSVSGRHVGHYKAAAQDLTITIVHATMMSLPFLVGFSPTRWRKVVDVMLEKEPGNPKLHRLRIIALIESDYNQSQRILVARRLSHRMEDLGIIPEMQYGSRPGKLCVSPVLNKQLTHDVIRQTKHTAAIIENDAVGCYDRLVNPLVLLAMRRMGVPETSARSIAQTWSGTTHSIKTQYGLSSATYQNTSTTPLFGPGQGSTTGPTLWQITFVLLEDSALGQEDDNDVIQLMHLESANGDLQLDNPGEAFVDDSNLGSTSSLPIVPHHGAPVDQLLHCKSAITNLHHLAQRWERALFSTGGAINFGKSFWFAFHWRWKNGVATIIPTLDTMTLELTEGDTLEKPILVPKKSVFDTYRTLGVHISPSGDTSAAVKVLLTKATQYQSKIATSHLPKEAALLSYTMFLLPQLGYPLPAMTLSEADCHTIQSPTLMALLPKLHLNRHIARSIVFGPHLYGGMSLKSLYFIQSIGQLTLFKGHIRGRDKSNKLLRISLSYLQLAVGSITSVLQLDAVKYSAWMENTWLLSFWKFLSKINLKVQLQDQWLPSVTREHDIALMDFFITQGYKNSQLGRLNRCRIYLQVITLADITSASGSNIIPDILSGIPLIDRKSHLQWPCQQRPPQGDWTLWAQALRPLQPRSTLLQPLGQWLTSTTHQTWFWFMDPSNSLLYQCDPSLSRWIAYRQAIQPRRRTRSQSSFFYDVANGSSSTAPEGHLLRTTICHDRYTGLSTAIAGPPTPTSPTPPAIPQPIYALIRTTEFFQPMMPIDLPHEEVLAQLAASRNSALYAVSRTHWDTSFVTYAWALFTQHPNNLKTTGISNKGLIPNVSSARRTELEGILQVIFLLHTICHYHRMSQGSVTILCFSKSLASSLRKLKFSGVSSALCDHGDIMTSLRYYICNFPTNINISFEHFDMTKPSAKVAFADQTIQYLAKLIASTRESTKDVVEHCQYIPPPHSEITLSYQGVPLLTNIRSTLRNLLHKDQITSTICKQEGWSEQLFHQVDWEAHEFALLRTWSCKRIAYIKLSHALLNTNVQNRKFYRKSDLCPCCAGHPETLTHVFTCQSPEVAEFRTKQQEILWHNLSLIQTPDEILDAIKLGILSLNREPTSKDTCPPVFQHQSRLGWEAFLRGRISFMWRSAFNPDADFDDKNSKKWAGQLTLYLLQYSQQLWTFRCGVLKGHNKEENRQKHREELLNQVQSAYEEFAKDPFHIPSDWRHMFHRPFLSLVQSDRDTLACWLRSYSEACQQQMLLTQQHQRHSVAFFSPFRREYQPHPNRESRSCIIVSSSDNSDRSSISSDAETYCPDDSNLSQSNDSRDDIYDLGDDEESLVSIDSSILQYAPFSCSATPHPR
jgi:hypothetical protein